MRLNLITIIVTLVAGNLVTATPIACTEVSVTDHPCHRQTPACLVPPRTNNKPCPQWKRDLILKGELPPEACCSYGRCVRDVVVAMF
jgi:hypothetical protein